MNPYYHEKQARRVKRQSRITRRERLREHGITPARRRRAYLVQLDAITVPEWAQRRALRDLTMSDKHVWLKNTDARFLQRLDEEAGGRPTVDEVEYRICPVCKALTTGATATDRRFLDESFQGRSKPCSSYCIEKGKAA